jgi:hypothetical protein
VQNVSTIQYRITSGGVQEMKRSRWYDDFDPEILDEAKSARASGRKDSEIPFSEAGLVAFKRRRTKLISEVEKIDATIASMQCH